MTGEQLKLEAGDKVEIWRESHKDKPGWVGPATVADVTQLEHGRVGVHWQGKTLSVGVPSIRKALMRS